MNYIKSQRLNFTEEEHFPVILSNEPSAQKLLEKDDLQQLINETIKGLPTKCQEIFVLCRLEHLSHKEIAEKMGISTKTVEKYWPVTQLTRPETPYRWVETLYNRVVIIRRSR